MDNVIRYNIIPITQTLLLLHSTNHSLRVERSVDNVSHMDLLMGSQWDVRNLSCTDGYRIILTLELLVDSGQEIILKMHATLISGKLEPDSYRAVCLRDTSNLHMICNRRLSDITNNRTRRLSDITNNASGAVITPGEVPLTC